MELFEAVKTRHSIRRFSDQPVEQEKLDAILEAVRMSPSWANRQCWHFIIIKSEPVKKQISECSYVESYFGPSGYSTNPAQKGIIQAPVLIAACADPARSGNLWQQPYYMTDMGIACQTLMLAAHDLELGTVFVGVFEETKIKKILKVPDSIRIVGIFPIGYPRSERATGPERKSLSDIVSYEKWRG